MPFKYLFLTLLVTTLTCFPVCVSTKSHSTVKRVTLKSLRCPYKNQCRDLLTYLEVTCNFTIWYAGFCVFLTFYHLQLFTTERVKFLPMKRL